MTLYEFFVPVVAIVVAVVGFLILRYEERKFDLRAKARKKLDLLAKKSHKPD